MSFVPVTFGTDGLGDSLAAAGFDSRVPTTWIWEGVLPYLTDEQARSALRDVAQASAPGSTLIATYPTQSRVSPVLHLGLKVLFALSGRRNPMASERHVSAWSPAEMDSLLAEHGFTVTDDRTQGAMAGDLGFAPHRPGALDRGRVVVARRAAVEPTTSAAAPPPH